MFSKQVANPGSDISHFLMLSCQFCKFKLQRCAAFKRRSETTPLSKTYITVVLPDGIPMGKTDSAIYLQVIQDLPSSLL